MEKDIFSELTRALDLRPAVSFREFVESPDFCGCKDLYDYWFREYKKLPEDTGELILDGSLGTGKTTFANYYMAYRIYKLLSEGSPQSTLGLAEDTELYVFYFSVSLQVAQKSGFSQLYNILISCKWFEDNAPINNDLKRSISIPSKHFHIDFASTTLHAIGLNVWGFMLDEANFKGGVGTGTADQYAEVTELYTQLLDRIISRNARADGTYDGLAILISSASFQSSFVEQRKLKAKDFSWSKCITSVGYEVKPWRYSKERFEVFIGNGSVDAQIITCEEQKSRLLAQANVINPEEFIRSVPVSLKAQFVDNIVLALQNHCGVPTMIQGAFMSNIKPLVSSYDPTIPPIFTSEELTASTEDDTQLIEYLIPLNIQYPQRPHSIYLDLSVSHDTGSLVCYRYDGKVDNEDVHTRVFSLKIIPPPYPAQTKIQKVKQLVVDLANHINIVAFGSDQYQCFTGDTLIPTKDGIKMVKDIRKGMEVFDGHGFKTVQETHRYLKRPVYKVTLSNGAYYRCTDKHRFVTKDGELVQAIDSVGKALSVSQAEVFESEFELSAYTMGFDLYMSEDTEKKERDRYFVAVRDALINGGLDRKSFFDGIRHKVLKGWLKNPPRDVIYLDKMNILLHLSNWWGRTLGYRLTLGEDGVGIEDADKDLTVVSVVEDGVQNVYDISVGGDELYDTCLVRTHNSTQLRQDITDELGLENIRLSLDSTDVPFVHWAHALTDGRVRLTPDKQLEKEVQECVHDYKRHRVIKNKKSSDDVLQGEVGAFFLSDTIGKTSGLTVDDLYKDQTKNLVGGMSYNKVLRYLGYGNKQAKR